jgi:translation initiation factor 2B subunit (eIF-2B alpha/beta/delta family)
MKEDIFSECPAKMSVTEKELRLYKNPNCKSLIDKINHFESRLIMLNSYMDSLEESIFVVSREITRRGGDSAIEGRGENVRRIKK